MNVCISLVKDRQPPTYSFSHSATLKRVEGEKRALGESNWQLIRGYAIPSLREYKF